ncbi:MAG: hypothetical protein HYS09_02420 [Chloroflexi bacterium]|nr:hypothetical protein [Chloroflexota bacterium]
MNREEVIVELKRVAGLLGRDSFSRSEFKRYGRVSSGLVEKRFGTWNKALQAAGLAPLDRFKRIADSELEEEWRRVYQKLGRIPTRNEFFAESKFSPSVYEKRFGNWGNVAGHYLGPQRLKAPLEAREPTEPARPTAASRGVALPERMPSKQGRVFGGPLNFRELRHEPVNEQGVVFLFGMVARELGFLVDAVGTGFPDCRAKRRTKGGYYAEVDVEFEFKSSNFREHGHDPAECDLVVCWEHDWPDCPVEVLELKSAIRQLNPNV